MVPITLTIGKWQQSYFRSSISLEAAKVRIAAVGISNDAFSEKSLVFTRAAETGR